jgi:glycosyltransferase involved in cell wall biosynthesis
MRVAYVLPYLQTPSGWRNHSTSFINAIREHVTPVLLVPAADEEVARQLFPEDPVFTLPVTQQASLSNRAGIKRLTEAYRAVQNKRLPDVDLVHSLEAYPTGLVGSWLAQKLKVPHVLTTHGTYGVIWHERRLDRLAYQQVLRRAKAICPVSHGTAGQMKRYFKRALRKTQVCPILNGNDFYKTVPRAAALERKFPETPTIISIGDVKPRKGHDVSLAAFAKVQAQLPQARYFIIGHYQENDYFRDLQRFIAENEVKNVTFTGTVSEEALRNYYETASLFVLTPQQVGLQFEGFGLVYLEAGAYGLPVVATRTGGVPDAVKDGITGFLREPGDVDAIAQAMLRLLTDIPLARRMGRANRQWAETLTWESYAKEQLDVYQKLLNEGRV